MSWIYWRNQIRAIYNQLYSKLKAKEYIESARIKSSEKEMEKILLKGTLFKDIAGILPLDLKKTFNALARNDAYLIPEYNLDFIKKSSQYLIGENLLKDTAIDYNSIVKMIDKKLMQSFIQSVVKQIVINEDKKIESIEFINGMIHRFVYR